MSDLANLQRLTTAVRSRQPLPPDVGIWVAARMVALIPADQRQTERNCLLRQAGALVGGSRWNRMLTLRQVIERERKHMSDPQPPADRVAELVAEALILDPEMPSSRRHILRILGENEPADSPVA